MCLAIVGKIESITHKQAIVDIYGVKTKVNIILIDNPSIGDYVLVHTGYAIEKVNQNEACSIELLMKGLLDNEF